jgi:UDP-N-acetylmuramate dehydrogenase
MRSDLALQFHQNFNLQSLNTLNVPSMAEYFVEVLNDSQIKESLSFAKKHKLPITVLGGGSNVVLPKKLNGLLVKNSTAGRRIIKEDEDNAIFEFSAGESWHELVMWCLQKGFYGLENLALIPGSVGAAPIQNIGAYGVELENFFHSLTGIHIRTDKKTTLSKKECQFAYRDSIFKHELRDEFLITSVTLNLRKQFKPIITYPALQQALDGEDSALTAKRVADTVIKIRKSKLPDPSLIPNAGSFFKNPVVKKQHYLTLVKQFQNLVAYELPDGNYKLAAGWLLDQAGWKGKQIDNIAMHSQQALVLTNPAGCTQDKILMYVNTVKESIRQMFGVVLEIEPRVY